VEHDEETIRSADHVVDLGPRAGRHGGEVVVEGPVKAVLDHADSLTGRYLRGELRIPVPPRRRTPDPERKLAVIGARQHNLRDLTVEFPLGLFVAVTGVSGSGKSTLVTDIVYRALARHFYRAKVMPGAHDRLEGLDLIDKVIDIDQSPIGRTPRSNPATYTGLFTPIRELYTYLPESKIRGYGPGRLSFNVKGGRCDAGRTLYILDEPTTGLHFEDVRLLLEVLHRLVDKGNTVVVIEHNLDVVKTADWVIDLGPEGGAAGGAVLAAGPPEDVARVKGSFTGQYLRKVLAVGD